MVNLMCSVCGKYFKRYKSHIKSNNVFCSVECSYKGRSLGLVHRVIKTPYDCFRRGEAKTRLCLYCNGEYSSWDKDRTYCSVKCYNKHKKEMVKGSNNPSWIDGRSYNKRCYRGEDWEDIRKKIYERDNYTCVECGEKCVSKKNKNSLKIIQCHHIENYDISQNNNENNLITLCLECHIKKHQFKNEK